MTDQLELKPFTARSALRHGLMTLCLLLVCCGVPAADQPPASAAFDAVEAGDMATVKKLIAAGLPAGSTNKNGVSLLLFVAEKGDEEMVKLLLEKGAPADVITPTKRFSPLHAAATSGKISLLKLFLEKGNDINAVTYDGYTPLFLAINAEQVDAIRFLLEKGADANLSKPSYNYPRAALPLALAISKGNRTIVELLVKHGADINAVDNIAAPAYFEACTLPNSAMLQYFLDHGADPDKVSREGSTPLMWAAANGSLENVKLLVGKGAKVDRTTRALFAEDHGRSLTAHDIAIKNEHPDIAAYLRGLSISKVRIHFIK